jgi:environmental stress-induced protein Ves
MLGFAWLDADAPFSDYRGHDRTITLVDGPGFTLDFGPSRPALVARRPYVPFAFDGGWAARCRVPGGSCLVLNAMTSRETCSHRVTTTPAFPVTGPPPGGAAFLVVLAGHITIAGQTAGPRDTLRLDDATEVAATGASAAFISFAPVRPRG